MSDKQPTVDKEGADTEENAETVKWNTNTAERGREAEYTSCRYAGHRE